MKIASQAEIKQNYLAAIGSVPGKYQAGVRGTTDWQEKAASADAENLYAAKVQEAISNRTRAKGVAKTSNSEWQGSALQKGAARIGPGMSAGADRQASNFEPYRQALAATDLPARSADPLANVDTRVKKVVSVLVDTKKSQLG